MHDNPYLFLFYHSLFTLWYYRGTIGLGLSLFLFHIIKRALAVFDRHIPDIFEVSSYEQLRILLYYVRYF